MSLLNKIYESWTGKGFKSRGNFGERGEFQKIPLIFDHPFILARYIHVPLPF
jgi:hypothetical protein